MKKLPFIIIAAVTAAIVAGAATRSSKNDIVRNLDIFNAVYKNLQTAYVDTIDADKSINTAISAMLNEIDPYTEYIPEQEQEEFMTISAPATARCSSPNRGKGPPPSGPDSNRATCSLQSTGIRSPRCPPTKSQRCSAGRPERG